MPVAGRTRQLTINTEAYILKLNLNVAITKKQKLKKANSNATLAAGQSLLLCFGILLNVEYVSKSRVP